MVLRYTSIEGQAVKTERKNIEKICMLSDCLKKVYLKHVFRSVYLLLAAALLGAISGCQTSALDAFRHTPGLTFKEVFGGPFRHQLVLNQAAMAQADVPGKLHVYIEGDGQPWHRPDEVAWDPSPKRALMLDLMMLDPAPAIYLGRPCYFSLDDPACSAIWWTHQRYAPDIVRSMGRALDRVAGSNKQLVLLGHSGGGALAMLLAAHRSDVQEVVTLAGNLDPDAWTEWHGYSPLRGSLNPKDFSLPEAVKQRHYVGSRDDIVPLVLLEEALGPDRQHTLQVLENADHHCCWREHWVAILNALDGR